MFEKKINQLPQNSQSATKKILRQFRNVKRMTETQYEQARKDYNKEVLRRKKNIKLINNSLDESLTNFKNGFKFDLNQVHNNYSNPEEFIKYLLERINDIMPDKNLLLTMGDTSYTINKNTKQRLLNRIMNSIITQEEFTESDGQVIQQFNIMENFTLEPVLKNHSRQLVEGMFFPYMNKTKYDFSRYGIFKTVEQNYSVCFLEALIAGGLSHEKTEQIKHIIKHSSMPKSHIAQVCDILKIKIILRQDGQKNNYSFGSGDEIYELGLIENHYFIYETTNNTRYSLEHYNEIKEHPRANEISYMEGTKYKYDTRKFINSMDLFRILLNHKDELIEKYTFNELASTPYFKKFDEEITILNYNEEDLKLIENNKKKEKNDFVNVFADFETLVYGDYHTPYLCCYSINGKTKSFIGEDCGNKMLFDLQQNYKKVRLIFHNATYDYQFLVKHLHRFSQITRGTHLLTASGFFNKMSVQIKCSYNLITAPLKSFGKMFKLDQQKEIMPYCIYTKQNIEKKYLNIDDVENTFLNEKDKIQFKFNILKWNLKREDETFDIIEYSRLYCVMDCIVLEQGYNTFKKWIMELHYIKNDNGETEMCNLDIDEILTSASLAHQYMILSGCYEGVYELIGTPQRFIQKTVVGGRTMLAYNKKDYINKNYKKTKQYKKINDFDGVSLYPSAMNRMTGFLKGKPQILTTTNYEEIKNYDGYFIEIKINSVPIKRAFPLISQKNKDGIRIFQNFAEGSIFVDKIQMEDLIKFHGLTTSNFEIIRGYYFNDGFNSRINNTIKYLFETRKQKKREKNPSQEIYKLIMNSAYGKSIMKEHTNETRFFDNYTDKQKEEYNTYISRNFEWIEKITNVFDCNKKIVHSISPINQHSNIAHVGSSVLSWSKRIMNEVMTLAEDNDINIFYQDTDSMHLFNDDIKKLQNLFMQTYNRELIGEDLGQFHTDFSLKYEDENGNMQECENVHSRQLIMLGKKCYIDELIGLDKHGNEHVGYHARMKGINDEALAYACDKNEFKNLLELFTDLYDGNSIDFDLCAGGRKAMFKFSGAFSVKTLPTFMRKINFK